MLNNFVKQLSSDNYTTYILDNYGKVLADPRKKMSNPNARTDLKKFNFVKSALSGKTGNAQVNKDGKKVLVSYIKDSKTGWVICSELLYNIAIQNSIKGSIITILAGIFILIVTSAVIFILAGYGVKPILELLKSTNKISQGDLTIQSVNINSKDELGDVGKSFEKMTANLHELIIKIKEYSFKISESSKEMVNICEQGNGFAVVAEEVHKLAEQSGEAAKQVNDIIKGIQIETENVISVMNKGISEVEDGSRVVDNANSYFEFIFKAIQEISENVRNVSVSIDDMTKNGQEVSKNLNTMVEFSDNVTAQTEGISAATGEQVASIEEMTASAQYLGQMSESLENLTNQFKTK